MSGAKGAKKPITGKRPGQSGKPEHGPTSWGGLFFPLGIFVLALAVRLIYLLEIESVPLFYYPAGDARSYDEWAQKLAAGDWLGQGVFYQAPLYPYFLGFLQFVIGHDLWAIRIVQITLGAFSCVLLYRAGSSYFSARAGIAAGLILSLYAPGIFFDALIQKPVLDVFLISLLLFSVTRLQSEPQRTLWIVAGAMIGLLGLSRENTLIWAPVVPVWIWLHFSTKSPRDRLRWIAMFLLGLVLILFPVGLRNLTVGGEFTLTTSQLGPNFFIGNNPEADGTYMPLRAGHGDPQFERQDATEIAQQALGRTLSPGEVSDYWFRRSREYIRSEPLHWLRLMARKSWMLWNIREFEDTDDFYLYQRWSWLLTLLGSVSHFGFLVPLAAVGMMLTWKQRHRLWLLYALLATLSFSIVLFYVFGRYRFSLVPLLVLFAGAAIAEGLELYNERNVRQGIRGVVAGLLVAAGVNWPIFGWPAPSAAGYYNVGNALVKQGRLDQAIESYQQALKILPTYALAYYSLGNTFAQLGQLDKAISHYQEALKVDPDLAEARNNLGNALAGQGQLGEAIGHFQEALKRRPDSAQLHYNLGRVLAGQGNLHQAVDHFREALRIQPEYPEAHESLARALAEQGNRDKAAMHDQKALQILKSQSGAGAAR